MRNLSPPGRFLAPLHEADKNCKDVDGKILWYDVGDKKARAKASQCLREKRIDCPIEAPPKKISGLKKRKNAHERVVYQNSYSSTPIRNKETLKSTSQTISYLNGQDQKVNELPSSRPYNQQAPKVANTISCNGGYYDNRWHYHYHKRETSNYCKDQGFVKTVTPCYDNHKRTKVCPSSGSQQNGTARHSQRKVKQEVGSECDHSWIGSFCSLDTKLMEDGENGSLSPKINQTPVTPSNRKIQTMPVVLRATPWTGSDVGSELTDNSHVDGFQ